MKDNTYLQEVEPRRDREEPKWEGWSQDGRRWSPEGSATEERKSIKKREQHLESAAAE